MNISNITKLETYKPRVEIIEIAPPGWKEYIQELKRTNWEDKHLIKIIYESYNDLWNYLKENDKIPGDILKEYETGEYKKMNFWKERSFL